VDIPAQSLVEIVTRGLYWVQVAAAVTPGYRVPAVLNATGQLTTTGAGSSTAFTGTLYKSAAAAGGLAIVSFESSLLEFNHQCLSLLDN
jgi:hypothetical protein